MTQSRLITIIVVFLVFNAIVATILFLNLDMSNSGSSQQEISEGAEPLVANVEQSEPSAPQQNAQAETDSTSDTAAEVVVDNGLIPELTSDILSQFSPLPLLATPSDYQMTSQLVSLGRTLFYDPRLSVGQQTSCNTCHPLSHYGVDRLPQSLGHDGKFVSRNSPTVYNAALHFAQFWDGRVETIEEQAKAPILNDDEMSMGSPEYVEQVIRSVPNYAPLFSAAFPGQENPITFDNLATAIAAFERGLIIRSRLDFFLEGDYTQLTEQEQHGMVEFAQVGCIQCHTGATLGGQLYKKLGEIIPYPVKDQGRYQVTRAEDDRQVFKVPSLRNVGQTGPYLHDGSLHTLEEMVAFMARHQLGKELSNKQIVDLVAFLNALTGEIPIDYIAEPPLPPSGPNTPKPGTQPATSSSDTSQSSLLPDNSLASVSVAKVTVANTLAESALNSTAND
ncbi:MAG: cytochrome c peroxidase [Chloroflexota bacterium]